MNFLAVLVALKLILLLTAEEVDVVPKTLETEEVDTYLFSLNFVKYFFQNSKFRRQNFAIKTNRACWATFGHILNIRMKNNSGDFVLGKY